MGGTGKKVVIDPRVRFEFSKTINAGLQEQIKLADTKAAWTFSVLGLFAAVLTNILSKFTWQELAQTKVLFFLIIAVITLVLAFKSIVLVMYPRTGPGMKGGLTYFRDIIQGSKEEYLNIGREADEEKIIDAMYSQSYELAAIAEKKFSVLRRAIIFTMIALGWIVVTVIMVA
jgi:hypothetical protein